MKRFCQCEHIHHFETDLHGEVITLIKHKYGEMFPADEIVPVKSEYGTFHVCKDCAETCLKNFI